MATPRKTARTSTADSVEVARRDEEHTSCARRHHNSCCGRASPRARTPETSDLPPGTTCPVADLVTTQPRAALPTSSRTLVKHTIGSVCLSERDSKRTGVKQNLIDTEGHSCSCSILLGIAWDLVKATYSQLASIPNQEMLKP